jgi:hypothetical protein
VGAVTGVPDRWASVAASLTREGGTTPVSGATVLFSLKDGDEVRARESASTGPDGTARTSMRLDVPIGEYTIEATFDGDAYLEPATVDHPFSIGRIVTDLTYSGPTAGMRGDTVDVRARLIAAGSGDPLVERTVEFVLRDGELERQAWSATTNADGVAGVPMSMSHPAGNYLLEARFQGDTELGAASDIAAFSIGLHATTITYTGQTSVLHGEVAALTAVLTRSETSAPIVGELVRFEILSGADAITGQPATTGLDGSAHAELPATLPAGTYVVRASYVGGYSDAPSADEKGFSITRLGTTTTYLGPTQGFRGESIELSARLVTANGTTRAGLPVTFRITGGGEVFDSVTATTDPNGLARTVLRLESPAGTHSVEALFDGTDDLEPSADGRPFAVRLYATTLSYTGAIGGVYEQSVAVRALLTRADGLPVAGQHVAFVLTQGGQARAQVEGLTGTEGAAQAALALDVAAGVYSITATFAGSVESAPSSDERSFTVMHRATATSYTGNTGGTTDEPILLSAALTRSGGAGIGGRAVVFDVISNSAVVQTALATTDSSGAAVISTPVQVPAGRYRIEARFTGDAFFSNSSAAADLVIAARGSTLAATAPASGTRGQRVVFTGTLTDSISGLPVAGKTLQFTLGSSMGQATTDSAGRARLEANLNEPPGSHTLKVTFAGDGFHVASEAIVPIEIRWEYTFTDSAGRGLIHLNPSTKEFRFVSPYEVGNIEYDPNMRWAGVNGRTIVINAYYGANITLSGTFELESGRFQATVSTPTRNYVLSRF